MSVGPTQLILILLLVLVLFGGSRLGAIGKGLGEGIRNFKKGITGDSSDEPEAAKEPPQLPAKAAQSASAQKSDAEASAIASSETAKPKDDGSGA